LITDDPGVVPRLDDVRPAGSDLALGPVVHDDMEPAGDPGADVPGLAAVGPRDRLDALRPPPPGFQRQAGRLHATQVQHVDPGLVGRPGLVRLVA
jgi:hypothetical protein